MQDLARLQRRVDLAYLTLAALRGSDADTGGLAHDGACACWRVRRLLLLRLGDSSGCPGWMPRVRSGWRARALLWGARPMQDLAAARLVRGHCAQVRLDLQCQRASFTPGWQAESLRRRVQELEDVVRASISFEEGLRQQSPPLWHSFISNASRTAR